jgi:hypothetical protein
VVQKGADRGGAAELTVGGEEAAARGTSGVLRMENGDGRGKRGRWRQAAPFFKWRGGGSGERGGGSVAWRDTWIRGWGVGGVARHVEKGMG